MITRLDRSSLLASLATLLVAASLLPACGQKVTTVMVDLSTLQGADDLSVPPRDLAARDLGPCGGPCTGATPYCDAQRGQCVACRNDGDCGAGQVCRMGACMPGCSAQHGCGDAGICEADAGACLECLADKDCARLRDPMRTVCDGGSGRCVACLPGRDTCMAGTYCADTGGGVFACKPGCRADIDCQIGGGGGASFACCDHVCIDTASSAKNCGACGKDCGGGLCCGGRCANVGGDVANCGACGKVCAAANAAPTCMNGMCGVGACLPGFADCNANINDGCEVSTQSDANNCGGCGKSCSLPNAAALCIAGACVIGGCNVGWKNCDGAVPNGCEQDVASDPKNCGTCGNDCGQLPNASATCKASQCTVGMCNAGFGNCDKNDANGCEAALAADPKNCGGCGMACPSPPNVIASCNAGVCGPGVCAPGYVDCNKNQNDGCEAQVAVDANNCGLCGNVCPSGANAVGACAAGQCTFKCNAGFLDCNNNKNDGCEVNGGTDNANCGMCGNACGANFTCANGQCVPAQQWYFANYNGVQNVWDPKKQWNGQISCSKTCGFLNLRAIGVRFICNLWGNGATEGCDAQNDGMVGRANCGKYIDNGVVMNWMGNNEDCAGGQIANCVANQCTENVTYHAIECQCAP